MMQNCCAFILKKFNLHYLQLVLQKVNRQFSPPQARFTLATAVMRLQIFAVARPKSARFTLASNFVQLRARKRKNHLNQIINK